MRWTAVLLTLAAAALVARPASAERELSDAVATAIQEVESFQADRQPPVLRNSTLGKRLRRGKKKLQAALAMHGKQKWARATKGFSKGLGQLLTAFREENAQPGLDALVGVIEELDQYVTAALADVGSRIEQLEGAPYLGRPKELLDLAASNHQGFTPGVPLDDQGLRSLLYAYAGVGRAGKKVRQIEADLYVDIAHIGKLIPGNLPKDVYSIGYSTNGVPSGGAYWTNPHGSKRLKQVIKNRIQGLAENRRDGRDCVERCTGTPFDGTSFTVTVVLTCTTGEPTTTVVFTVRRVGE